jgi:hypothetical protein
MGAVTETSMKPREIANPQPGFFRLKLARNAPWTSAVIFRPCPLEMHIDEPWNWLDRWPRLAAEIDGIEVEIERVWHWGQTIKQAEYEFLRADHAWCRNYAPTAPEARPQHAVDVSRLKPVF